jgi:hypothetical protein
MVKRSVANQFRGRQNARSAHLSPSGSWHRIANRQSGSLVILESMPGNCPGLLQNASLTGQHTFTAILQPTSPDKSILEKGASIFPEHGADLTCYRGECLAATLYLLPPLYCFCQAYHSPPLSRRINSHG